MHHALLPATALLAVALSAPAAAQVACREQLFSNSSVGLDAFGSQVSYSPGRAILGGPSSGPAGAAAVFEFGPLAGGGNGWFEAARLVTPTASAPGDGFGAAVSISGNIAVVGAPFEGAPGDQAPGAAYVFRRNGAGAWVFTDRLVASGVTSQNDRFGIDVELAGTGLIIGAVGDDTAAPDCGAAYIYRLANNQWILEQKVLPTTVQGGMRFGLGVSIQGNRAVVGAPFEDYSGLNEVGAAYVYERQPNTTWPFIARFTSPVLANNAFFGVGVDVAGGRVIAGAEGVDSGGGPNSGAAFIFFRDVLGAWSFHSAVLPPISTPGATFGNQVEILGNLALVSARGDATFGPLAGAAHLYQYSQFPGSWPFLRTLYSPSAAPGAFENFGSGICLVSGVAIVGSPGSDVAGINRGGATLFDVGVADCNANGTPDSCDIVMGIPDCNQNGVPDSCDVATGTSLDCNNNGIPDSCDIATGTELDCNGNQVPDSCDIATMTSTDCDLDTVPDECQIAMNPTLDCNQDGVLDSCQLGTHDCNLNGLIDTCEILAGTTPDLNGNLRPDSCEVIGTIYCTPNAPNSAHSGGALIDAFGTAQPGASDVMVRTTQLPPNVFGYYLNAPMRGLTPFPPGSVGILCLSGSIGRHQQQVMNSGAAGEFRILLDLLALPRPVGTVVVMSGETWRFQSWYRDALGGLPTSNFSDAVEIQF